MNGTNWIVLTTINAPTQTVRRLVELCPQWQILVVGDRKTPKGWNYPGVRFLGVDEQSEMGFVLGQKSPFDHYARKNLGYLYAIARGAQVVLETDDDNIPYDWYPGPISQVVRAQQPESLGWQNVYRHFTDERIWPRGFPLEFVNDSLRGVASLSQHVDVDCPIQQFLADDNPDVDAVFRMTREGAINFKSADIALGRGAWCPFNSQNTLWWPDAYPYLYLPGHVTFRMTDIWRSFVAQSCLHTSGAYVAFRTATMYQRRNDHSLIRDFRDEVPGYLNNATIMARLAALELDVIPPEKRLRACYRDMVAAGYIPDIEMEALDAWIHDLGSAREMASTNKDGSVLCQ